MKRILMLLVLLTIVLVSCQKETGSTTNGGEEREVEMIFSAPATYGDAPVTRSSYDDINELDILVFKDGMFQYRRTGYRSGDRFRSTLKIGDGLTLYFFVNCRSLLNSSSQLTEGNDWDNDIQPSLIDTDPTQLIASTGLPMWGQKKDVNVTDTKVNRLGTVSLLRSVASVDIEIWLSKDDFELTETYLYYTPDMGYLAPTAALYDAAQKEMKGPVSPGSMATSLRLDYHTPVNNGVVNKLFLYDNNTTASSSNGNKFTKLVVGGIYKKSGIVTYYPLEFHDGTNFRQMTRNHKYIMGIKAVHSEGWPTPDDAVDAAGVNLDYEIIDWDLNEDLEIIVDGTNYISLESKYIGLERKSGSTNEITFTTNIATEKLSMRFQSGSTVEIAGGIENDRFRIEYVFDNYGEISHLKATALGDYSTTDIGSNTIKVLITSGRIRYTVTIEQTNELGTGWNNGGTDKDIDLGNL